MQAVSPQSAAWRLALLRQFRLENLSLDRVHQPVLILASEVDRLLPSQSEAKRLARFLPNTTIVHLPDSGHACLLENQLNLSAILKTQDLCPDLSLSTLPVKVQAQAAAALW
jgi:pimeloyl-ACP methyl ester carboxylesterase